ncbi:DUF1214 domain-containing protein [Edaphobacter aggregans]|uniref:DUF1214 domain-containing protein n=1 Tax=Edaphobacter aggregans TaxID=570835 RepID=UPI001C8B85D8
MQHDSPGTDKDSSWLPAPNGPFVVFMRLYGPQARDTRRHMEAATPHRVNEQPYGTNQPEEGFRVLSGL